MWLFGNRVSNNPAANSPGLPFGWLISLALRHVHKRPSVSLQSQLLKDIDLAIDFAAAMDCQRYNPFDEMVELRPADLLRAFEKSMRWHVLFALPQIPPPALRDMRKAFSEIDWPPGTHEIRREVDGLLRETADLLRRVGDDPVTITPKSTARVRYPFLFRLARAAPGTVNADYLRPFDANRRNHQRFVFFETTDGDVVTPPSPLAACAAYVAAFERVWSLEDEALAKNIVSDVAETAVFIACMAKRS